MLLVLGEVLGAHVLNLRQLLIIPALHVLLVLFGCFIDTSDKFLQSDDLIIDFFVEGFGVFFDFSLDVTFVIVDHFVDYIDLFDAPFIIYFTLLVQLLVCEINLVLEVTFCFRKFWANFAHKILISTQHVLVLINQLTMLYYSLTVWI